MTPEVRALREAAAHCGLTAAQTRFDFDHWAKNSSKLDCCERTKARAAFFARINTLDELVVELHRRADVLERCAA